MSHPQKALGAWVAGIRETFEEVGDTDRPEKERRAPHHPYRRGTPAFQPYRQALNKGEMKFSQIMAAEDIVLPGDCLYYFSHWITPELFPCVL